MTKSETSPAGLACRGSSLVFHGGAVTLLDLSFAGANDNGANTIPRAGRCARRRRCPGRRRSSAPARASRLERGGPRGIRGQDGVEAGDLEDANGRRARKDDPKL